MKIPLTELIDRLHRAQGDADTAQLMEAAASRLQDLDIECATLRHGLRLANRRADDAQAAQGERQPAPTTDFHESCGFIGAECNFPLCKPEVEQVKIDAQVYRELYSGE